MDYLQYKGKDESIYKKVWSFKPCYKWITFNTIKHKTVYNSLYAVLVLNLVINGLPSILQEQKKVG